MKKQIKVQIDKNLLKHLQKETGRLGISSEQYIQLLINSYNFKKDKGFKYAETGIIQDTLKIVEKINAPTLKDSLNIEDIDVNTISIQKLEGVTEEIDISTLISLLLSIDLSNPEILVENIEEEVGEDINQKVLKTPKDIDEYLDSI